MLDYIGTVGANARERVVSLGAILGVGYAAVKAIFLEGKRGRRVVIRTIATQIYFTAVQPLPFFLLTALLFGFVAIVQVDRILPRYGLSQYVPNLIMIAIVREISPLVIAMILIGRTGTAIATELGYMRLNQELDALSATGINIDYFIVLPRVIGVTVATLVLMVAFSAMALVGGYVVGRTLGVVSITLLFREFMGALTPQMIGYALLKAFCFGMTIACANCYHGLRVRSSFTEIPRAAGSGVIYSVAICFVVNALISVYAIL